MNFVGGGSLFDYVSKMHEPVPEKDARFYIGQILVALESMHQIGIIYRDLKLENVLLETNGLFFYIIIFYHQKQLLKLFFLKFKLYTIIGFWIISNYKNREMQVIIRNTKLHCTRSINR